MSKPRIALTSASLSRTGRVGEPIVAGKSTSPDDHLLWRLLWRDQANDSRFSERGDRPTQLEGGFASDDSAIALDDGELADFSQSQDSTYSFSRSALTHALARAMPSEIPNFLQRQPPMHRAITANFRDATGKFALQEFP